MKYLIILALALFSNKACTQQNQQMPEPSSISYQASTRGSHYKCTLNKGTITVTSQGIGNSESTIDVKKSDWEKILQLLDGIDLDGIKNIQAPSEGSKVDRAAIATLKVVIGGKVYESASFDDGYPPAELKPLIDNMMRLAEAAKK